MTMNTLFSKLYIFKQYQCLPEYLSHMHLHSNLVIFKYSSPKSSIGSVISLHSNLVIFKLNRSISTSFYSSNFTFQPGYIQILILNNSSKYSFLFTFQPGYIQIHKTHRRKCLCITLHSNLVIFKYISMLNVLIKLGRLYIPTWLYSNEDDDDFFDIF